VHRHQQQRLSLILFHIPPQFVSTSSAPSQNSSTCLNCVMARQGEHLPAKRRKLNSPNEEVATTAPQSNAHKGLDRPISPPLSRRRSPERTATSETTWSLDDVPKQTLAARPAASAKAGEQPKQERDDTAESRTITSPVQLTRIAGLGAHHNIDAVGLGDLLGDPLIKECWNFNFLFDIDFVMCVIPS
jgi:tyrosyl-DNA phosphodiesterase-1